MNKTSIFMPSLSAVIVSTLMLSPVARADTPDAPGHPRVNEVNQRLDNQQQRIENGVAAGQITPRQAAVDERRDAHIAQRESVAEARHGGHLTLREQHDLNRALNRNSKNIHDQRHD
jgi:hypothetical protein